MSVGVELSWATWKGETIVEGQSGVAGLQTQEAWRAGL